MAIILHIDTAVEGASVCLAKDRELCAPLLLNQKKDQPGWLHENIGSLFVTARMDMRAIDAVAVTIGPGSYTGLRVGLSAAKGLCFALNKPLIAINTLEVMAFATIPEKDNILVCPMIDARRMEVFTAVYDRSLKEIVAPCAMILNGTNFDQLLERQEIIFSGNGSTKLKNVLSHKNAHFSTVTATAADMTDLAYEYYKNKKFADLAYTEPFYVKEFYSPAH